MSERKRRLGSQIERFIVFQYKELTLLLSRLT